jgi:predicted esterase
MLFRRPGLLRGAALLRPMLPYEPEDRPTLAGTAVLVDAGESDPYSSPEQARRLAEILRDGGAAVTVHTEPRAGHNLTQNDLNQTARWLATLTDRGD